MLETFLLLNHNQINTYFSFELAACKQYNHYMISINASNNINLYCSYWITHHCHFFPSNHDFVKQIEMALPIIVNFGSDPKLHYQ